VSLLWQAVWAATTQAREGAATLQLATTQADVNSLGVYLKKCTTMMRVRSFFTAIRVLGSSALCNAGRELKASPKLIPGSGTLELVSSDDEPV